MQVITSIAEAKALCRYLKKDGTLGFVPTMGFLHEGHLSLVDASVRENDSTIVSIFVNPSQFGRGEDLNTYPRDLDRDLALIKEHGAKYVFYPKAQEIYPPDYKTWITVENLSDILCGKSRPTHFRGVTTIVLKLLNIVLPDTMYMGLKDYQQLVILQKMLLDLNMDARIIPCPIIREADGLAMSSRNSYLSEAERSRALCLSQALKLAQELFSRGERQSSALVAAAEAKIELAGGQIDYIECIDPISLKPVDAAKKDTRMLMAVYIGRTRLIDNCALGITNQLK